MLSFLEVTSSTYEDFLYAQNRTASMLESLSLGLSSRYGLKVPFLDSGTNYVPQDTLAMIHKGEAVIPAAYNPINTNSGSSSEDNAIVQKLNELQIALVSIAGHTNKTRKVLENSQQPDGSLLTTST
jgi:hypothetical protein